MGGGGGGGGGGMRVGKGVGGGGCGGGGRGEEEERGGAHLETPRGSRRAHGDRATQRQRGGEQFVCFGAARRGLLMADAPQRRTPSQSVE